MTRRLVVPFLSAVLEPYLEERHRIWLAQGGKHPTLPITDGGKLNLTQLVRDLAERDGHVKLDHQQHFYRKPELRSAVNSIAEAQGLTLIGNRSPEDGQEAAQQRIGKMATDASELRRHASEREVVIDALRAENAALREQLRLLEETGMVLRAGSAS